MTPYAIRFTDGYYIVALFGCADMAALWATHKYPARRIKKIIDLDEQPHGWYRSLVA